MSLRVVIALVSAIVALPALPSAASARSCAAHRVHLIQNDVLVGAQHVRGARCATVRTAIRRAAERWAGIPMSRFEPERLRTGRVVLICTSTTDARRSWVTRSVCRRGGLRVFFTAAAVVAGARG